MRNKEIIPIHSLYKCKMTAFFSVDSVGREAGCSSPLHEYYKIPLFGLVKLILKSLNLPCASMLAFSKINYKITLVLYTDAPCHCLVLLFYCNVNELM